jgi:hypothetical protein
MQVIDTTSSNRAIVLKPTEMLRSERLVAALIHKGSHTRAQAVEQVSHLFDCVEEQLLASAKPS